MNEIESEQAQAIAAPRYRAVHTLSQMTTEPDGEWVQYDAHKAIVDSQAQKIAELEKTVAGLQGIDGKNLLRIAEQEHTINSYANTISELAEKLAIVVRR